jgi:hypothetical protein
MPTGTVIYFSMVYMFLCSDWDEEIFQKQAKIAEQQAAKEPTRVHVKIS